MGEIKEDVLIDDFPDFLDMDMINYVETKHLLENRLEKITESSGGKSETLKKKKMRNLRLRRGGAGIDDNDFEPIGPYNTFWKHDSSKKKRQAQEIRSKVRVNFKNQG